MAKPEFSPSPTEPRKAPRDIFFPEPKNTEMKSKINFILLAFFLFLKSGEATLAEVNTNLNLILLDSLTASTQVSQNEKPIRSQMLGNQIFNADRNARTKSGGLHSYSIGCMYTLATLGNNASGGPWV